MLNLNCCLCFYYDCICIMALAQNGNLIPGQWFRFFFILNQIYFRFFFCVVQKKKNTMSTFQSCLKFKRWHLTSHVYSSKKGPLRSTSSHVWPETATAHITFFSNWWVCCLYWRKRPHQSPQTKISTHSLARKARVGTCQEWFVVKLVGFHVANLSNQC